ncbi:MAG: hypothetical protein COT71_00850 [Candidatus Andersenbacteria bacterium CG10_big_fil_rev_8_21_14_0_10_54_11]|uniref:Uncharacterized protein n=1 Tax=Candidatus Andersenbacteria bacterium CG10_big_fil_rev_8_21_14_0_10_54_11 TaxID=1974485 RepID=A0A2M6X096_9BACT|nr:MAG: hypothetical protein COT71_00850 [Candidatus Andersenbacteria bacterium CG10_big_fil_rev_8_21_14_0_10_54_11]
MSLALSALPAQAQNCDFGRFEVGFPGLSNVTRGTPICSFAAGGSAGQIWLKILISVANWLLTLIIMLGVLGVMIGGYYYMAAAGDSSRIKTAKEWIFAALAGVSLAVMGYIILHTINPSTLSL